MVRPVIISSWCLRYTAKVVGTAVAHTLKTCWQARLVRAAALLVGYGLIVRH